MNPPERQQKQQPEAAFPSRCPIQAKRRRMFKKPESLMNLSGLF
jgi:hypothetical protein